MTSQQPDPIDQLFHALADGACLDEVYEYWFDVPLLCADLFGHDAGDSSIQTSVDLALQAIGQHPTIPGIDSSEAVNIRTALESLRDALAQFHHATAPLAARDAAQFDRLNPSERAEQ
jgi:hypothetical protein